MKYINAKEVLPRKLINEIQTYITGKIIYIPQVEGKQNSWGSKTGTRDKIKLRNNEIRSEKEKGKSITDLMNIYNLAYDTIKKIVYSNE